MRSPNKIRLKYLLDCCTMQFRTSSPNVKGFERGKGMFVENTFPPRVRTLRSNETVHQRNPPFPLSEDEVRHEMFPCVRGLESRKGVFAENTSPPSESAEVEQNSSLKSSFAFERRRGQTQTVSLC